MARDDFEYLTKKALAERAGYLCSFPRCSALTLGPSDEGAEKTSKTGMACHISAASEEKPSRRYDKTMTPEQRKSIDNGVWLCYTHGKLVDTDETAYTIPMLIKWKQIAEYRAKFLQANGSSILNKEIDFHNIGLAEVLESINNKQSLEKQIGDSIELSCVPEVWGKDISTIIRDFLIEVALNSFDHGSATTFELSIKSDHITTSDDGVEFDIWDLPNSPSPRGGAIALNALLQKMTERVIVTSSHKGGKNEISIAKIDNIDSIVDYTPCVVKISSEDIRDGTYQLIASSCCKVVYVVMPEYCSPSLSISMEKKLKQESHDQSRLIFVLRGASTTTTELVSSAFPKSRIVHMP